MAKDYFNNLLFKKAVKYIRSNPERSRIELKKYLEMYPNDYYTWVMYIGVLISLEEFKLAEKLLKNVFNNISINDYTIRQHYFENRSFEKDLFYVKAKLLSYTGRYEELYEYFRQNEGVYEAFKKLDFLKIYCKKKLGILSYTKENTDSYIVKQIIEYSEDDMRKHIEKHLSDYNLSLDIPNVSIFCPDFPIDEIIQEVKKYIPSSKKILTGLYDNAYYFKYDYCGKCDGKQTCFFLVTCFDNTENIITMCPVLIGESLPYEDLNYLNEKQETSKVKKISQIDKFNRRYNR